MMIENSNPRVDAFVRGAKRWHAELAALRALLQQSGLAEDVKWGKPCYTLNGANVAILYEFKDYAAVGFLKGTLLRDDKHLLEAPGEHSQAMRMFRFTDADAIRKAEPEIRAFIADAIRVEQAGLAVQFQKSAELALPDELLARFEGLPALKAAFEALTPGRQRGWVIYFTGAKQRKTREERVERSIPLILEGKGPSD
jgi:uncharacterized protein YdeI (YjbR/CyaY-like superfamily)